MCPCGILVSKLYNKKLNSGLLKSLNPQFLHRLKFHLQGMALSKWEYVKFFEAEEILLPNCFAVARLDGRGFHKLAKKHEWQRPNDLRAINLMTQSAKTVMKEFSDIVIAYGQSDEFSFVFRRETEIFQRRSAKILSTLVSKFSSAYTYHWNDYFPGTKLLYPPSFDCRMVLYPTDSNLKDYLCWRQADCHINNLYNTVFWTLVQRGKLSNNDAQQRLSKTLSAEKNEILFSEFGINYNNEPEVFRKGTVLIQKEKPPRIPRKDYIKMLRKSDGNSGTYDEEDETDLFFKNILELNCDIIGEQFWIDYPYLLSGNNQSRNNKKSENNDSSLNRALGDLLVNN